MPRTAAKFTQADFARAIRAAKAEGMVVRVLPDGTMEFVEKPAEAAEGADLSAEPAVAASREFRF